MHLTAAIAREAGIPNSPKPFQLRIDKEQNVIVASTPSPAIEKALETLQKISVGGNTYEVAVYPVAPDNSCKGVIYNIGIDCSVEKVWAVIDAPGYEVLSLRRLGSSSALVITLKGKKVPFYIYVHRVLTRCYLYKRTVAYCTTCQQSGHRADVCPNPPETPRCKDCGVTLSGEQHECHPECGLCGGAHTTAAKPSPKRFLPPVYRTKPAAQPSSSPAQRPRSPSPGLRKGQAHSRSGSRPSRHPTRGASKDRSSSRQGSNSRRRTPSRQRTPSTPTGQGGSSSQQST
ncbi:hypothetical protein MTO96_050098 [Rhipicephalus appendiculatus]